MEASSKSSPAADIPALLQVGVLPIRFEDGRPMILLLTSRETKRWVIPKGWPMKGKANWAAAAQEAKEEAGIIGKTRKDSVGSFIYFKRRAAHFDLCRVEVYVLNYDKQLEHYREKGQRDAHWFPIDQAAEIVDEPGLTALLRDLDFMAFQSRKRRGIADNKPRKKHKHI